MLDLEKDYEDGQGFYQNLKTHHHTNLDIDSIPESLEYLSGQHPYIYQSPHDLVS